MGKLTVGEEHIGRRGPLRGILVRLPEQSDVSVQSLPISPQWLETSAKEVYLGMPAVFPLRNYHGHGLTTVALLVLGFDGILRFAVFGTGLSRRHQGSIGGNAAVAGDLPLEFLLGHRAWSAVF